MGHIQAHGNDCFPILRYVSFNSRKLRLFVTGDCPGCDTPWVGNVCAVDFCTQCSDLITSRFPSVLTVILVLTQDIDFNMIVRDNSCSVVRAFDPDGEKIMRVIKKMMLDWHPDISCFIKILSNRDRSRSALDITKDYSWNQV